MAATLHETLLAPDVQPQVVADCETMIKDEVSDMSGISGAGIKIAYKAVNAFAAEHVRYMLDTLMPRMADQLQPYWADFNATGATGFGEYLAGRGLDEETSTSFRIGYAPDCGFLTINGWVFFFLVSRFMFFINDNEPEIGDGK